MPHLIIGDRWGKTLYALGFFTRALPCFTELHSLFYPKGIKVIPENIYELLTPVALAHLIMGDGLACPHGLILCTNCFSIQDTVKLINVLIIRYSLECRIRIKTQKNLNIEYMIYIRQSSMTKLWDIRIVRNE